MVRKIKILAVGIGHRRGKTRLLTGGTGQPQDRGSRWFRLLLLSPLLLLALIKSRQGL